MGPIKKQIREKAPHADWVIAVFALVIFLPVGVAGLISLQLDFEQFGSVAIAYVTGVTAVAAIYQLRRPSSKERPAVRPSFASSEDNDLVDFGLKNYGPGPALYLQLELIHGESGSTLLRCRPRDEPLHLPEGDFLGFVHDSRTSDEDFCNEIKDLEKEFDSTEMVDLHFSYSTPNGQRIPNHITGSLEREDDEILCKLKETTENPLKMELSEIQNRCTQE